MRLLELRLDGIRNLSPLSLSSDSGLHFLAGPNGAGKTSVVEALHVLGHGRSFRTASIDSVMARGRVDFTIFGRGSIKDQLETTLGMARSEQGWRLQSGGQTLASLVDFVGRFPVITFEPGSHMLVQGSSEHRRRYLDWLLFHVEPTFLTDWRRYMRALRQRNAALRGPGRDAIALARSWEPELVESGESIHQHRAAMIDLLAPLLSASAAQIGMDLSALMLRYRPGWVGVSLADALDEGRASDIERGFTQRGPHRGDWRIDLAGEGRQQDLSRGQSKLLAISCLLAQASVLRQRTGDWPILIFDDLCAELDRTRQSALLDWLVARQTQVFITGTEFDPHWQARLPSNSRWFHVEQGQVRRLL